MADRVSFFLQENCNSWLIYKTYKHSSLKSSTITFFFQRKRNSIVRTQTYYITTTYNSLRFSPSPNASEHVVITTKCDNNLWVKKDSFIHFHIRMNNYSDFQRNRKGSIKLGPISFWMADIMLLSSRHLGTIFREYFLPPSTFIKQLTITLNKEKHFCNLLDIHFSVFTNSISQFIAHPITVSGPYRFSLHNIIENIPICESSAKRTIGNK